MPVRPFVMYPDPRLRTAARPVAAITDEIRAIWDDMLETMYAMPGYGLAAPQIGIGLRLAVVDCSERHDAPLVMANPEILHASERMHSHEEASPNLPGVSALIARPRAVTVGFLNAEGAREERDFVLLWAPSVQHQIDHLDGRLFVDRLGRTRRDMILRRAAKLRRS